MTEIRQVSGRSFAPCNHVRCWDTKNAAKSGKLLAALLV